MISKLESMNLKEAYAYLEQKYGNIGKSPGKYLA